VKYLSFRTSAAYDPVVFRIYFTVPSSSNTAILAVARALGINPSYLRANERNIDNIIGQGRRM
jgi:hypothetical protein